VGAQRRERHPIPEPDYTWVDADYVAIGWNLISQRVFVY
jgi:hypothetical protein